MVRAGSVDRHRVQFYEDAGRLADQVAAYFHVALAARGGAIAIARTATLRVLEGELRARGHDIAALAADRRLVLVDADAMLSRLIVDGAISRDRFQEHVAGAVRSLREVVGKCTVHAYGEMVDVLWTQNQRDAVFALEAMWSELLHTDPLTLVCGYQLRSFDNDVLGFDDVCHVHGHTDAAHDKDLVAGRVLSHLQQRARALELEVMRRTKLEQRMLELLELSGQLVGATDAKQIAQLTIDGGRRAIGAVDGALWTVAAGGTHLQLLAETERRTAGERYRVIALAGDTPLAQVIRTGEPVFLGNLDEYTEQFPISRARLEPEHAALQRAFAVLPVAVENRVLGGIVFSFDHEREFLEADRAFKAILARQCALALARAEQHEQERALREAAERAAIAEKTARTESELLYELIAGANSLDDVDSLFALALQTVCRGAGSDRAAILLFDADGVMRFKASHGLSETYRAAVEGHSPWTRDAVWPPPITVDDTETDPAWASYRDVFRAEGIRALAFVPLVLHRKLIGKFMLYRNEPRAFGARELQFAATVAVHVAQADERKQNQIALERAYRTERDAHFEAEEATRAREEILSVVSHDLRNPLGTILMGATSLLTLDGGDKAAHRTRSIAERIHRQAVRMARLIEDLVDFAGIQAGKLAIERSHHKPEDILSATSDIFTPLAQERGLRFETRALPNLPRVECDSDRVVQVLSNLVGNALKVTPKGGAISIGAETRDDETVFFVSDTGPGIDAEELPQLFQRYWRSKHSQYKGAGLGLSIARGIVDAHGGRIWAESRLGAGSTFYFSLASLRNN